MGTGVTYKTQWNIRDCFYLKQPVRLDRDKQKEILFISQFGRCFNLLTGRIFIIFINCQNLVKSHPQKNCMLKCTDVLFKLLQYEVADDGSCELKHVVH
jgi:hypothetical protein